MDYDLLYGSALDSGAVNINKFSQRYAMDYQHMNMNNMSSMLEKTDAQALAYSDNKITFNLPAASILEDYGERASKLRLILWLLQIPVIMMILVYLFMVSQLNVEQEKTRLLYSRAEEQAGFRSCLFMQWNRCF